ncbi:MAG: alpha-ketoacid dehydrogenase subunit beta [Candidatus Latescibacteria bacterium]|nr:alpha-ketoacid dehydrogenase subunit beta [Candidatus Latescibacterota bacterium]
MSYEAAINEALHQEMAVDTSVFLIGQGVKSPWYVGSTCTNLLERFGEDRVIDTPVSENAITGAAVGAALAGMRAIVVHPRVDFLMYGLDPLVNEAANWHYMNGGKASVPVVVWGIINRGGEQAAQHSQSLHAWFAHVPGLKVVMPSTPYDAKGLLVAAIRDNNPVVYMSDRWLHGHVGEVPEETYEIPIGKAAIRKTGTELTIVASSHLAAEAVKAAEELGDRRIDVEVVDLRTIKPLDREAILISVRKTGRLLVVDGGWASFGVAAEVAAVAAEQAFDALKGPIKRLALPDTPAPASQSLEQAYYKNATHIVEAACEMLGGGHTRKDIVQE